MTPPAPADPTETTPATPGEDEIDRYIDQVRKLIPHPPPDGDGDGEDRGED